MADKSSEVTDATSSDTPATVTVPKKKSNKTLWIVLGVILTLFVIIPAILFTVAGVFIKDKINDSTGENLAESLIESASGGKVDVDSNDGNISVESEDGSKVGFGTNQKLPDDFPKDKIPYIDEKSVTFVVTSDNEDGHSWSVSTTVDRSYEEAVTFFEDRIKSPDYGDVSNFGFGNSKTFYGTKDTLTVSITVTKSDDGVTGVSYTIKDETVHNE